MVDLNDLESGTFVGSGSVLTVGLGALAGVAAFVAPFEVGGASAVVLLGLARHPTLRFASVVGALAFFVAAWMTSTNVRAFDARRAEVESKHWPARCALHGIVVRSPVVIDGATKLDVDVDEGTCEESRFTGRVTLHLPGELVVRPVRGDRVAFVATLAPRQRFWNEPSSDPRPSEARTRVLLSGGAEHVDVVSSGGVYGWIDRVRYAARGRIASDFPEGTAAMARALVLGEDDMTDVERRAFRQSGLAHLLAVSGMHLVLVVTTFVRLLRSALVRAFSRWSTRVDLMRVASAFGIPCAFVYADFAGGSGSAVRAAWMMSVAFAARVLDRRPNAWRALGLSIFGVLVIDRLAAFDLSFLLSLGATGGLLLLGPWCIRVAERLLRPLPDLVVRPFAATFAASLACAPILVRIGPAFSIVGLVANVVAVPLGETLALPLCLAHVVAPPLRGLGSGLAIVASGALAAVRFVAMTSTSLDPELVPFMAPTSVEIAIVVAGTFVATQMRLRMRVAAIATAAVLLLFVEFRLRAFGAPRDRLRVTFLDVGQGDSALVDFPDGRAMLIDGGGFVGSPLDPGDRAVLPILRLRRRSNVAVAVLSHPHPDHFLGLRSVLRGVSFSKLWDTGQGEDEAMAGGYAELLGIARNRSVEVMRPSRVCGTHSFGAATVEVIAPCPEPSSDRGPNDNSFVIRIRFGLRSFLFMGDAEHGEESDLVRSEGKSLRADVIKVGHHGSHTSSTEAFLGSVSPKVAVISCGVRNRFGHPNPNVLVALARSGARVFRTDRDGAVVITTDGTSLDVTTTAP